MAPTQNFADSFINAFQQGQQVRTRKRVEAEAEEDRAIEKELLAHRLKELKIQEKIRARAGAKENLSMLEGQPENTFRNATDEDMRTGGTGQVPGIAGTMMPGVPIRKPTIEIPGIEELNLPGISRQPQTLEEILAQNMAELRMKARNTPQSASRGQVITLPSEQPGTAPEVLATGQEFPEPMVNYTTRGVDGIAKTERITQSEANRRGPAIQHPLPQRGSTSGVSDDDINDNVEMYRTGQKSLLDLTGNSTNVIRIIAGLKRAGVDVKKGQDEERAVRSKLRLLDQPGMINLAGAVDGATMALNEIKAKNQAGEYPEDAIKAFKSQLSTLIKLSGGSDAINKELLAIDDFFSRSLGQRMFGGDISRQIEIAEKALDYRSAGIASSLRQLEASGWAPGVGGGSGGNAGTTKSDADVAAALAAQGRANDPATVAKVKANAEAMKILFPQQ